MVKGGMGEIDLYPFAANVMERDDEEGRWEKKNRYLEG